MYKREDRTDFLINNYVAATRFNYKDAHGRVLAASSDIDEIMLLLLLLFYIFLSAELGTEDSDHRHASFPLVYPRQNSSYTSKAILIILRYNPSVPRR